MKNYFFIVLLGVAQLASGMNALRVGQKVLKPFKSSAVGSSRAYSTKKDLNTYAQVLAKQEKKLSKLSDPSIKSIYAPWRDAYTTAHYAKPKPAHVECPFCTQFGEQHDKKHFILRRFKHCVAMLNLHPYNKGHILIVPYGHVASPELLDKETRSELMEVIAHTVPLLKNALGNIGANIGVNIGGNVAGGSLPNHLHVHILPRWQGDTSFITALARVQVIAGSPKKIYKYLKSHFDTLELESGK